MAIDISVGHYCPGESPIHRLDPRTKLTLLIVYIVAVFLINNPWTLFGLSLLTVLVILLTRIPLRIILKSFAPLSWILLFPLIINLISTPDGFALVQWAWLRITDQGLYRAIFMTMRLLLILLCTTVLTLTSSQIALCDGVESMLAPLSRFGFPAHEIAMMTSIALRFIPLLLEEAEKIRRSQMSRGAEFDTGGPFKRMQAISTIIVPLFANAFDHAEDLALAMESRCYRGGAGRTHYHELRIRAADWVAFALGACVLALSILF